MEFTSSNYKLYFNSRKYNSLTHDQRVQLLRFTVSEEAKIRGLSNVVLDFRGEADGWHDGNRGAIASVDMGDHIKHYMEINEDVLTRNGCIAYSAYKTICHELEHGVQNLKIYDKSISNGNTEVAEYRANYSHYYQNSENRALYLAQVKEAKAREAGIEGLKKLLNENFKTTHEWDEAGDNYIRNLVADESAIERKILRELGAHPREELAKAAMYGDPSFSSKQFKNVLKAARKADFEMFERNYGTFFDKKELQRHFNNNTFSPNYFESKDFVKIRTDWKFGRASSSSEDDLVFFEEIEEKSNDFNLDEDSEFFELNELKSNSNSEEDIAFFEEIDHQLSRTEYDIEDKSNNEVKTMNEIIHGHKR